MRKTKLPLVVTAFLAAAALTMSLAPSANAKEAAPKITVKESFDSIKGRGDIIYGGTTQSTDPTRYDYVPADEVTDTDDETVTIQDAYGATFIPAFNYSWKGLVIPIPGGLIEHGVYGKGLRINRETAAFGPYVGNWQICNHQWQLQNRFGETIYSTVRLPVQTGCRAGFTKVDYRTPRTVKYGQVCARLYVAGYFKGQQCHHVYP